MRAIQKSKSYEGRCTPNVLPCRINHNGAINASKRYWNPTKTPDGKTIAYFRGRKLRGRQLKVPAGYKGVVLVALDTILPAVVPAEAEGKEEEEEQEGEEEEEEVPTAKIMEEKSVFDEIMIWGHEAVMDESDPFVRGLEEWVGFAEQIHSYDPDDTVASKKTK